MTDLTKYFFNRCFELLNNKAFDTYRVSLHNPYTIIKELEKGVESFNKRKIKHFDPTITSIGEEVRLLLDLPYIEEILIFKTFSKKQIDDILTEKCIKAKGEYNRTLELMCKAIIFENSNFTKRLFERICELLLEDNIDNSYKVDKYTSWLLTQQLFRGYSRKFLSNRFRKSHSQLNKGETIEKVFEKLILEYSREKEVYKAIFKLKSESIANIKFASQAISQLEELPAFLLEAQRINAKFKELDENEIYVEIIVDSLDFWSALKLSHRIISETIEINILHKTENTIVLENQAIVYSDEFKTFRIETLEDLLDGHYEYNESEFNRFIENYKNIKSSVAKEKLRSAIRFYKLGNDSLEIEHKILNYWIGFEQLFSAVDSNEDSIKRIKTFYVTLSCCYYLQRRINYILILAERKKYTINGAKIELKDLKGGLIESLNFEERDPLLEKRLMKYINDFNVNHSMFENIKIHKKRLELHLSRIYKIRNELVHEGRTHVDLNLVASHLRHYLLFSIEQITNEINENPLLDHLDDVFVFYENLYNQIIKANNIEDIFVIKEFKGYME